MEAFLSECAKYGIVALSFGLLLWKTLQDKDRMAAEMNQDKRDLVEAYRANTEAFIDLRNSLDRRPCLYDEHGGRANPAVGVNAPKNTDTQRMKKGVA